MRVRALTIVILFILLSASCFLFKSDVRASGYTWTDENGVTHFSDEKPGSSSAPEHEEPSSAEFREESYASYERRYSELCGNTLDLHNASVTLLDIYIERLATLQREIGTDLSLTPGARRTLLTHIDTCFPNLLAAKETAQQRDDYHRKAQDVLQQKMQRFDKLKEVVSARLEQRRTSSMAKGAEGARFYSDLRPMEDNPLEYGMTEQDVRRLWGEPINEQSVATSSGEMNRVRYPLGIDLYFRDGLLETWGWRK